jgi:hypothetical protein
MVSFAAVNSDLFFPWVESGGLADNVGEGVGFAVIGLVGAMVTAYFAVGGFLPSTAGKADYDALEAEIADLSDRLEEVTAIGESFVKQGGQISQERRDEADRVARQLLERLRETQRRAERLKHSLLIRALPFYLVVGAAFAVLFAQNLAQALLIGFAWTAVAERFGLKRELEKKQEQRGDDITKLERAAREGQPATDRLRATETALSEVRSVLAERLAS